MERSLDEIVSKSAVVGKRPFPFEDTDGRKEKKAVIAEGTLRFEGTDGMLMGALSNRQGLQVTGGLEMRSVDVVDNGGTINEDVKWWGQSLDGLDQARNEEATSAMRISADGAAPNVAEQRRAISAKTPKALPEMEVEVVSAECGMHDQQRHANAGSLDEEMRKPETPNTDAQPEYDTCFGVVLVEATLSTTPKFDDKAFFVKANGAVIKFYRPGGQFAGLAISEGIGSLIATFSTHLTAILTEKDERQEMDPSSTAGGKAQGRTQMGDSLVRMTIYGLKGDTGRIGKHLSDAGLYLQHPLIREYDSRVPYYNPHLLLRPGASMPRIEDLSVDVEAAMPPGTAILDEVSKGRLWRIFDSANGNAVVPDVKPSLRLKSELRGHQLTALAMMIEKECGLIDEAKFPTLWDPPTRGEDPRYRHAISGMHEMNPTRSLGGILADEMGLGKTLSALALICWHLDAIESGMFEVGENRTTLIVAPKSTLIGWESQIEMHIKANRIKTATYHGPSRHQTLRKLADYDIVLTTYEVLRQDFAVRYDRDTIYSHRWYRIILDEAHRIRSRSSALHKAALFVSAFTRIRWCLSGTPIQNSLDDYGALLSFLHVPGVQKKRDFDRLIATPYRKNEPCGIERLQTLIRATSLRRTMAQNGQILGLQHPVENVELVELSGEDRELYQFFQVKCHLIAREAAKRRGKRSKTREPKAAKGDDNILTLINFLRLICNYGERMLPSNAAEAWKEKDHLAVDWQMMQRSKQSCSRCNISLRYAQAQTLPCGHEVCPSCLLKAEDIDEAEDEATQTCKTCRRTRNSTATGVGADEGRKLSAKVEALIRNLRREQRHTTDGVVPKSIVFSCWTRTPDLIQQDLRAESFAMERVDGTSSLRSRRQAMKRFAEDPTCTVLLATIGSAGEGIDLIAACHVHILEPQWNPMTESQAIGRAQRLGQRQRVTVTRYIVSKSIETYIQWIQADKLRLISQSMDQNSISQADLDEERWKKLGECLALDQATSL